MNFNFVILEGTYRGRIVRVPESRMQGIRPLIEKGKIKPTKPQRVEDHYKALCLPGNQDQSRPGRQSIHTGA